MNRTYSEQDSGGYETMTIPDDMQAHNAQLIAAFRTDGGKSMGDRPLLLLTTTGRRTGRRRTTPMMFVEDGDRHLVIASNAGAPRDPDWYRNLIAAPDGTVGAPRDPDWYRNLIADPAVTVEVPGQEFKARATPLSGEDYDRTWAEIQRRYPFFTAHPQRAGRTTPGAAP